MLSTIVAIIFALATGTPPAQPSTQTSTTPTETKEKPKTSSDPAASTYGGVGQWTEG